MTLFTLEGTITNVVIDEWIQFTMTKIFRYISSVENGMMTLRAILDYLCGLEGEEENISNYNNSFFELFY